MKKTKKIEAVEHRTPIIVEEMSIWKLYDDFGRKGYERIKLVGWPHKNATSCATSIRRFFKTNRIRTIRVFTKKGEVYLEKVEP
jgi:hypothetical protein